MKQELEDRLVEAYPTFYTNYPTDGRMPLAIYGFECGDGWYPLIDAASAVIELYNDHHRAEEEDPVQARQVKEKRGELRIYPNRVPDQVWGAIHLARQASQTTCELCGATQDVEQIGEFYPTTRCSTCRSSE